MVQSDLVNLTSVHRAVEILGDSKSTIRRMIERGDLKGQRLPGRKSGTWVVDLDDVHRIAAERAEAAAKALASAEAERAEASAS